MNRSEQGRRNLARGLAFRRKVQLDLRETSPYVLKVKEPSGVLLNCDWCIQTQHAVRPEPLMSLEAAETYLKTTHSGARPIAIVKRRMRKPQGRRAHPINALMYTSDLYDLVERCRCQLFPLVRKVDKKPYFYQWFEKHVALIGNMHVSNGRWAMPIYTAYREDAKPVSFFSYGAWLLLNQDLHG